jgi:hypothetical protein
MSGKVVILVSSLNASSVQEVAQRRLEDFVAGKYAYEKVDGSMPDNKPVRDILFAASGQRGKYPQSFIKKEDGSYTFIGLWDEVSTFVANIWCVSCSLYYV